MILIKAIEKIRDRRGVYLVEASISMPIFIIAVVLLMSVVQVIAQCENIVFSTVDEMRFEAARSSVRKNNKVLPLKVKARLHSENRRLTYSYPTEYRYLYSNGEIDDLIKLQMVCRFKNNTPVGAFDDIVFKEKIVARAFTGTYVKDDSAGNTVYIFPDWGNKYHGENCTYVKAGCQLVYLTDSIKNKYKPCKLCNAKSAHLGNTVYCFKKNGKVYHLGNCRTVDRFYIHTTISEAVNQGFTPCFKCGGG